MDLAKQAQIITNIHDTLSDLLGKNFVFVPTWVARKLLKAKGY